MHRERNNRGFQTNTLTGGHNSSLHRCLPNVLLGLSTFVSITAKGPFQWPIIGNLRFIRKLSLQYRGQHQAFIELSRRYSSNLISIRLGRSSIIVVSGFENIQKVFTSEVFDGRPWNEFIKLRNMGLKKGITMADGPEWRTVRAWLVRSLRRIGFGRVDMSASLLEELQIIFEIAKDGGVFCMKSLISMATINVIWTLIAGKRISNEKLQHFLEMMKRRAEAFDMAGGLLSMFPWVRYVAPKASGYNLLVTLNDELKSFLKQEIDEHKKNYTPGKTDGDLIDLFLEEIYERKTDSSIFNEDQLFIILLDLLIAGLVTTSVTLEFVFLRVTVHQEVQRRLHEELDRVIGRERLPELKDRPNLPYAAAVLTESQRMQMVLPIVGPRRAWSRTHLGGYDIPKDSYLLLNVFSVFMNPKYYPEPDSFKPERFLKDGSFVHDEKLVFFGAGHRRCPGEAEAKSVLFLFFVGIMHRFQLLPKPGEGPPDTEPSQGLVISPKPYESLFVPRQRIDNSA
ncbi:probable cytochrome P450 305a1 isoform X2 [Venturia canescens]|uniref:probable cytochrome P450 305a1 isoform X2 n=1 Tax=Venturia canescens TaxID=32260 RepID=UPI001C9D5867|nr:probable cytochrome P450 305a1 isoform X2 [Venturia canescens]